MNKNNKRALSAAKRPYRGTVQTEVAALTRQRILEAAFLLYTEQWIDQITLDQVADRAGVTVQTILRHFESKEGLWTATGRAANDRASQQRAEAPVGDIAGAVRNLLDHYEEFGASGFRSLALEGRYPEIDALIQEGRLKHREWVERVFAPFLAGCRAEARDRLIIELIALCDLYVWKLLRLDLKLTREQTEQALIEMLTALLKTKRLLRKGER